MIFVKPLPFCCQKLPILMAFPFTLLHEGNQPAYPLFMQLSGFFRECAIQGSNL
jgi:hypothetical protein